MPSLSKINLVAFFLKTHFTIWRYTFYGDEYNCSRLSTYFAFWSMQTFGNFDLLSPQPLLLQMLPVRNAFNRYLQVIHPPTNIIHSKKLFGSQFWSELRKYPRAVHWAPLLFTAFQVWLCGSHLNVNYSKNKYLRILMGVANFLCASFNAFVTQVYLLNHTCILEMFINCMLLVEEHLYRNDLLKNINESSSCCAINHSKIVTEYLKNYRWLRLSTWTLYNHWKTDDQLKLYYIRCNCQRKKNKNLLWN